MGKIGHIEFAGTDGAALKDFYGSLFGWEISRRDMGGFDYFDITTDSDFTAGIRHEPEGCAEIVVYIRVEDVDGSVATAQALGAGVRIPPMDYGDLRFALITDPQGNPVGLTQARPEIAGSQDYLDSEQEIVGSE
jgi:predicted enzyme related to lactoylglutathione lyase